MPGWAGSWAARPVTQLYSERCRPWRVPPTSPSPWPLPSLAAAGGADFPGLHLRDFTHAPGSTSSPAPALPLSSLAAANSPDGRPFFLHLHTPPCTPPSLLPSLVAPHVISRFSDSIRRYLANLAAFALANNCLLTCGTNATSPTPPPPQIAALHAVWPPPFLLFPPSPSPPLSQAATIFRPSPQPSYCFPHSLLHRSFVAAHRAFPAAAIRRIRHLLPLQPSPSFLLHHPDPTLSHTSTQRTAIFVTTLFIINYRASFH